MTAVAEPAIDFDDGGPPVQVVQQVKPVAAKTVAAAPAPTPAQSLKQQYAAVSFYRRNGPVSLLVLLGVFTGLPLVLACLIVLSGDVYQHALGDDGKLQKWGVANRYVAVLLLLVWAGIAYVKLTGR